MERVRVGENVDIEGAPLSRALALRPQIQQLVEQRQSFITEHKLDVAFCLPGGNWDKDAPNDYLLAYAHIRDGGYDVLNRLKFYAQFFSGYSAMTLHPGTGLPSVRPIPPDLDEQVERNCSPETLRAHWRALIDGVPASFWLRPPAMCGEHGWRDGGTIVNPDTIVYQERISLLYDAGVLSRLRRPRILEIGGGYGALARALMEMLGAAKYVICDLPESLMFSGLYLSMTTTAPVTIGTGSADGFALLPNYRFDEVGGSGFDLVINTISMSEMTSYQVEVYARSVASLIGARGVFFEQNTVGSGPETATVDHILPPYFANSRVINTKRPVTQGQPKLHSGSLRSVLKKRFFGALGMR